MEKEERTPTKENKMVKNVPNHPHPPRVPKPPKPKYHFGRRAKSKDEKMLGLLIHDLCVLSSRVDQGVLSSEIIEEEVERYVEAFKNRMMGNESVSGG